MSKNSVYDVVLARRVSSDSTSINWDLTENVMGPFTDSSSAYALAREKNDEIPDEYSYEFRYLVIEKASDSEDEDFEDEDEDFEEEHDDFDDDHGEER